MSMPNGSNLFISGRLKDIINRGGEKIAPALVEQVLLQHPSIDQAVVFGIEHTMLGETVAAAIVLKPGQENASTRQIRSFVAERLARSKVPQRIVVVDAIPVAAGGKLDRSHLAAMLAGKEEDTGRDPQDTANAAARTVTQRRAAAVFAEVLGIEALGIHDDFFDLGGHSLTAMQVLGRLHRIFQIKLPIDCLFENPTVARLSQRIGEAMADLVADGKGRLEQETNQAPDAKPPAISRHQDDAPGSLSSAQQRVYFLDRMGAGAAEPWIVPPGASSTNTPVLWALDEIRRRHQILRTTFHMRGSGPVQLVSDFEATRLAVTDLTSHPAGENLAEAMRIASQEAAEPFDLEQGPLFRARLLRLAADDHMLLLTIHHIVFDGWSTSILHTELKQLYQAFHDNRPSPLDDLPFQYGDYAAWQQQRVETAEAGQQTAYWIDQLSALPPLSTLPTDRPRPANQSFRGATLHATIDRQTTDRLKALSRSRNVTLFMTVLAAFKTLLFRYNGQDDCVVGTPHANRPSKDLERLIGFFADTLVLRTSLAGDPSFADLLSRVRKTALDAYAHQNVSLEHIVERLKLPRDPSYTPLFQVMFAFQNTPELTEQPAIDQTAGQFFDVARGLTAWPVRTDKVAAKFDLTLYLSETPKGMVATWQFNADLYELTAIEQLARHFQTLLEGISDDADQKLSELALLSEIDRDRIVAGWNATEAPELLGQNYVELFEAQVERTPDAMAVLTHDGQLTFRELNRRANRLGRYFRRQGVVQDTLVGICLPRLADMLAVMLGVWKAGGAFLPLDPHHPPERIGFMLRDAGVIRLVTTTSLLTRAQDVSAATEVICIDTCEASLVQEDESNPAVVTEPDALAYVLYTSGSSGAPKGAMITHANVGHYAQAMALALGVRANDIYLHTASFSFSSSIRQFAVPLSCGAAVSIASVEEIRDPRSLFETVRQQRVSILDFVPSFSAGCLQALTSLDPAERADLLDNQVRLMLSASEPLPSALIEKWRRLCRPQVAFINMFGQTETTGIVTVHPIAASDDPVAIVPIGKPIANTQIYVLDALHRPVPAGISGELYVGGAGIGRGYINDPERTASNFIRNPFRFDRGERLQRTGDLARYRPDGTIEILGRLDDQIKIRGFRIEPGEIEAVLLLHPEVRECVVGVTADASEDATDEHKRLVAFVAANEPGTPETPAFSGQLREFLKQKLPDYMLPQRIVTLQHLPRSPNGKIDRGALLARQPNVPTQSNVVTLPFNRAEAPVQAAAETVLTKIWKTVLQLDDVGPHDNFFDLGGNSMLSISIVVEAGKAGMDVDLRQLYQHQTIRELAGALAGMKQGQIASAATSPAKSTTLVSIESLRAYGREALTRAGSDLKGAEIVTDVQLEASLRGQPTHDMVSIPRYASRVASAHAQPLPADQGRA